MSSPMPQLAVGSTGLTALDPLEWAAWGCWTVFGVRIGVRVDDAAWLTKVREYLPPGSRFMRSNEVDHLYSVRRGGPVSGTRIRRFHQMYAGSTLRARTLDETEVLDAFESAVRFDVAGSAANWVFVHAGAVGWKGFGIVIPGSSTYGKSRLVEALVRAGATYYSDEFAVLDRDARLYPFAKPLTLRRDSGGTLRATAAEIGGKVGVNPLPIRLIVSTRFEPHTVWRPREPGPGESLLILLGNTVRARLAPRPILMTLARAVAGATTLDGLRGDARAVAGELLLALDRRSSVGHAPAEAALE